MMLEFNEIANTPIDVELNGKTYKVRRVSLDTIFGKAEAAVLATQIKRIHLMAEDLDGEDKSSFLAKAMIDSLPTGQKLNDMTASYLRSVDGVRMTLIAALIKDQPDVEKEITTELISSEASKVATIIEFAIGRAGKKPVPLAVAAEPAKV